jgi:acyl-CoA thioesterase FadM
MSRPTEPFVHRRRILWGETDAARIAYTARFLDFAMEAAEA